ncbi:MAG: hypothetical protein HY465_00130 [Deltaproteobacteria bacterium]|nr:hypothetical protein [Deltaproteobacteria bacterium]
MIKAIPTEKHLSRLYFELSQLGAACVGERFSWPYHPKHREEVLCLAADCSRYDPRLITILVRFVREHWQTFNPSLIRSFFKQMRTPQTIAVVAEFVRRQEKGNVDLGYFCEYLQRGIDPAPMQFYFHHLYHLGGRLAERAREKPLAEYKRWGFLACEAPRFDEKTRTTTGTLDAPTRRNILKKLLTHQREIRMSDYLDVLDHAVSRQQALIDLKTFKGIEQMGSRKGTRWRLHQAVNN